MRICFTALAACAALAACDAKPGDIGQIEAAIRTHVSSHKFCVGEIADPAWDWKMNVAYMSSSLDKIDAKDAPMKWAFDVWTLKSIGFLAMGPRPGDGERVEFNVTDEGRRWLGDALQGTGTSVSNSDKPPLHFCYAGAAFEKLIDPHAPTLGMGQQQYEYRLVDPAPWAQDANVRKLLGVADILDHPTGTRTAFVQKNDKGEWEVKGDRGDAFD